MRHQAAPRLFQRRNRCLARHARILLQKLAQTLAPFQIIRQRLERNPRPTEHRLAAPSTGGFFTITLAMEFLPPACYGSAPAPQRRADYPRMNLESMPDMCRIKPGCAPDAARVSPWLPSGPCPRKGWCLYDPAFRICLSHRAAPAPISFFFLTFFRWLEANRSEREMSQARGSFCEFHRSAARTRFFVFKTLTRARRAVAIQQPGVEDSSC
jgi:hypothetical protein